MSRTFTVAGDYPAYGAKPGETVTLDPGDPGVQVNIAAGVLTPSGKAPEQRMTCPSCAEQGMKRPPKFDTADGLREHYAEKHPALVVPDWKEEGETA